MSAKKTEDKCIIKWTGSAGIEAAETLHKELVKSFKSANTIYLDMSELEDIDITGIQIIMAAKKEADEHKKNFYITGTIPQTIAEFVSGCNISFDSLLSLNPMEVTNA